MPRLCRRPALIELLTARSRRVKTARRLLRRPEREERQLFLAEGWKNVVEAYAAGVLVELFATPQGLRGLVDRGMFLDCPVHQGDDAALGSLSDAVTSQGLVGVCRSPVTHDLPERARLVVVCVDVADPGNAGTIIRTADAVGADAVVLAGDSVDALNPKTVRATVGSLFHLPIVRLADRRAVVGRLRARGLTVLATAADGERSLFGIDDLLTEPVAWVFGNEAHGLDAATSTLADHRISIPIAGRAESLNLSTAAGVCLYASARIRELER